MKDEYYHQLEMLFGRRLFIAFLPNLAPVADQLDAAEFIRKQNGRPIAFSLGFWSN
jgi:hypothetical protein